MFSIALQKSLKIIIVPIDNRLYLFYSTINDIPISISNITILTNTLVAKETSSDILLGRVQLRDAIAYIKKRPNSKVSITIFSQDRSRKLLFTIYAPNKKTSVQENQLQPEEFAEKDIISLKGSVGVQAPDRLLYLSKVRRNYIVFYLFCIFLL